ncbi:MAG: LL-diaminopimelate aminotransferase [Oscillospiraceae bacterium]|jgi:LL-diaminopimelate aminotransferase|nr:LL-diaminopimelate aminotransferase [Oscillospiraceae bacterium]
MTKINKNFSNLGENYLFAEIARRVNEFKVKNPGRELIRLGIGDVTLPLAPVVVEAMKKGCDELGVKETFKGYPDYEGYLFLREAVAGYYKRFGVKIGTEEIFISDGAKSDAGNIVDLFAPDNRVLVTDPVYPVYVDTNILSGREIVYADSNEDNGFAAMPGQTPPPDLIYLCSPNNPTGTAYTFGQLKAWVDYALENKAVILYDAAYEAFIEDEGKYPRSIFAVDGARRCAIEFASLSKTAGFTGTRCGYTVIPLELEADGMRLRDLWYRRQSTKFNGVSYPVQCAAAAVFSDEGLSQIRENIAYYKENAAIISGTVKRLGWEYTGGVNSPYIWFKCPGNTGSWEFFDTLLNSAGVVGTPGEGFGKNGKGWFRFTAFGSREATASAMNLLDNLYRSDTVRQK